ncbi:extracellular serine-rich protein [Rutstroemia sp. NJR-2017a BBW]|nr:extracellular serine-rich protein [Rutstroemia sp. NJR-2017a BBW]
MQFTLVNVLALAAAVMAETITVDVGKGGLHFSPEKISAQKGDEIVFHFYSTHSVATSSFSDPCVSGADDVFSGVQLGTDAGTPIWTLSVTDATPIWLYCSVGKHCQNGMAAVINEPSGNQTIDAYKEAAVNVEAAKPPAEAQGGSVSTETGASGSAAPSATASASGNSTKNQTMTTTATSVLQTSHTTTVTSTSASSSGTAAGKSAANKQDQMSYVLQFLTVVGGLAAFVI